MARRLDGWLLVIIQSARISGSIINVLACMRIPIRRKNGSAQINATINIGGTSPGKKDARNMSVAINMCVCVCVLIVCIRVEHYGGVPSVHV